MILNINNMTQTLKKKQNLVWAWQPVFNWEATDGSRKNPPSANEHVLPIVIEKSNIFNLWLTLAATTASQP